MHINEHENNHLTPPTEHRCCHHTARSISLVSRRQFVVGLSAATAVGGLAMLAKSHAYGAEPRLASPMALPTGTALRVKPVLVYQLSERRELTSWRPYGGLKTRQDVDNEVKRIDAELKKLSARTELGVEILPLALVGSATDAAAVAQGEGDAILVYAAGGSQSWLETLAASKKPNVLFVRHKSGPVYLWYEIAHWRLLRKSEDTFHEPNLDVDDIVVDDYNDVLWRLRALYGLKNTLGTKVVAIGGLQAYSKPGQERGPVQARELWKFDIRSVPNEEVGRRIKQARADAGLVKEIQRQTEEFLSQKNVMLQTERKFVVNTFLAARVFKEIMAETGATCLGVGECMGGLIRLLDTPPCLVLSLLNDEGYTAYCHTDFTHTPPGILLHHISGKPSFVSNSHFPHHGQITLAHCSAPRKMDGKHYEPTRVLTHFESDYGAATKVQYKRGQITTNLIPNLVCTQWWGFRGKILDSPAYDMCRSQMDVAIQGDWQKLLKEMQGFHTITCYGDYLREVGYALKKVGVGWQNVSEKA